MMALPDAVITTPVSMPLNTRISSSLIIEGTLRSAKIRLACPVPIRTPATPPSVETLTRRRYSLPREGEAKSQTIEPIQSPQRASVIFIKIMQILSAVWAIHG